MQHLVSPRRVALLALLLAVGVLATACDSGKSNEPMRERLMGRMADEAVEELREQGAAALPELVELARDPEPEVARTALAIIGFLDAEAEPAIPAVIEVLQHPDEGVRGIAVQTLKGLKKWSTPYLVQALPGSSGSKRSQILLVMSKGLGKEAAPAVGTLTKIVRTGNATDITHAAMALASIGSAAESAIPALEAAVDKVKTNDQRKMIKGCIKRISDAHKPGMYTDSR